MFANTSMMGMDLGFPDVCLTPAVPAPLPVPYPNIAMSPMAIPSQTSVFIEAMPVHNLATEIPMTNGDNGGVVGGVASGTDMGPSRHLLGAETVLVGGTPVTRLTSMSLQNSTNCPGLRAVPSEVKVLVLAA
jgi:hypothetical protein